jgi:hypothetical protein
MGFNMHVDPWSTYASCVDTRLAGIPQGCRYVACKSCLARCCYKQSIPSDGYTWWTVLAHGMSQRARHFLWRIRLQWEQAISPLLMCWEHSSHVSIFCATVVGKSTNSCELLGRSWVGAGGTRICSSVDLADASSQQSQMTRGLAYGRRKPRASQMPVMTNQQFAQQQRGMRRLAIVKGNGIQCNRCTCVPAPRPAID